MENGSAGSASFTRNVLPGESVAEVAEEFPFHKVNYCCLSFEI